MNCIFGALCFPESKKLSSWVSVKFCLLISRWFGFSRRWRRVSETCGPSRGSGALVSPSVCRRTSPKKSWRTSQIAPKTRSLIKKMWAVHHCRVVPLHVCLWCSNMTRALSGQHMSPVSSEDPRHQDRMQGDLLPGGQRSVLRPLFTQPLWRRRPHGTAGSCESFESVLLLTEIIANNTNMFYACIFCIKCKILDNTLGKR